MFKYQKTPLLGACVSKFIKKVHCSDRQLPVWEGNKASMPDGRWSALNRGNLLWMGPSGDESRFVTPTWKISQGAVLASHWNVQVSATSSEDHVAWHIHQLWPILRRGPLVRMFHCRRKVHSPAVGLKHLSTTLRPTGLVKVGAQ